MPTDSTDSLCPPACPGCPHRRLSRRRSEEKKTDRLKKELSPWKNLLLPITGAPDEMRTGYREKACLAAGWDGSRWQFGLTSRKKLIPIPECPVHSGRLQSAMCVLAAVLPGPEDFPLKYYVQSGAQVTLVIKSASMPDISWLDAVIGNRLNAIGIEGLWLHLFPSVGKKVFAKNGWHLLWGTPRSRDADGFAYGPVSFQQVFPGLHKEAMDEAEAFLSPASRDSVIDLYCGTGRTLYRWINRGAEATGVELGAEAVECARQNVPGANIFRGACAHRIVQLDGLWRTEPGRRQLLYANPPRTGVEPAVIGWISEKRPLRMVYMSCNAKTLSRDLEKLCHRDFEVIKIRPYDFFPGTGHVEIQAAIADRSKQ